MYKTNISVLKWIIYDIFGNVGWLSYYVVLLICFIKKPEFMKYNVLMVIIIIGIVPAILMLIGIVELINERIHKLDFILPKKRVYRGFGALTLGGIFGFTISLIGVIYTKSLSIEVDIIYLYVLLLGSLLCLIFSGLCFKGYKKID